MQITPEDFQRYLRIFLQWLAGALVSYGFIKPEATWVAPAIGMAITVGSFAWTLYGNRVQAKVNEVAGIKIQTPTGEKKLVETMKVNSVEVAIAAPDNVTPTPKAA